MLPLQHTCGGLVRGDITGSLCSQQILPLRSQTRFLPQPARSFNINTDTQGQINAMLEERRQVISNSIRVVPHFPKEGIMFQDITTLLLNPIAFQYSIEDFVNHFRSQQVDVVAGFEARGFIFGPPIALALHCPFVPLRKPGKLPGETVSAEYELEYGKDKIEMSTGAVKQGQRVLLIDDLIATGGTMAAGVKLMQEAGAQVIACACVIELPELHGREKLGSLPLYIQVEKEGV